MQPDAARAVIAGAGIAGSSIAYHLARLGWREVVVVDQGELVGGTTSHAPGLVGQLRSSVSLTRMLMYSAVLYRGLSVDGRHGFQEVGSLRLASSKERLLELKRQESFARGMGLQVHLIGPTETLERFPLASPDGIEGALYIPSDGSATAPLLTRALIEEARALGVTFLPRTRVTGVEVVRGRVAAVETTAGRISTETLVVACGIWSPRIARLVGISLPLIPMQHQYVTTEPLAELTGAPLPNLRDPDKLVYLRQNDAAIVMGGYERDPAAWRVEDIPEGADPTLRPFDRARFAPLLASLVERVPRLSTAPIANEVNGLESFTPDGEFLLGPAGEPQGMWFACGFCAHGIAGSGGVGRVMAEWIADGEPEWNLWHMDLSRIGGHGRGRRYVEARTFEVYQTYYDIAYPQHEHTSARDLRRSPMHGELEALGASFGEKAGWERPNWFVPNEVSSAARRPRGWAGRNWSPAIAAEHAATRERVGLFDVTSFSKLEVSGPGALALLERLCANAMGRPVGAVTYTQLCNQRGGIECDLTVTRIAEDRFLLITGAAFGLHDLGWIRRHLPSDGSVQAVDVTSSRCAIGLWGPRARDVLQRVTDDDVSNATLPYMTARAIDIGPIPALAMRVTYVGELGWEIYAPAEYGRGLWQKLWEAGRAFGIMAAGYRAIDSLRLEKGYRYWSAEVQPEYTPFEAGVGFAVRLDKGDFLGRDALVKAKARGLERKLCCLVLEDPTAVPLGNEPIFDVDRAVGRVTSGGYGYTVAKSIAYAYLPTSHATPGRALDAVLFGERVRAIVTTEPLYDPRGKRVRG